MRQQEQEITDRKEIESLIDRAEVVRIGLTGKDGPYIIPMNFAYNNGVFYLHSASEGKKIEMLKTDSRVCVELDETGSFQEGQKPCKGDFSYSSVIAFGNGEFINSWEEKAAALSLITRKYSGQDYCFTEKEVSRVTVVKVICTQITGKHDG